MTFWLAGYGRAQRLIKSSAPLAGHHRIDIVAPAMGTDEPSAASPALAASSATLGPIGNRVSEPYRSAISAGEAIGDGSVRSFAAGSGTCATFGDGGFATTRPQGGCGMK